MRQRPTISRMFLYRHRFIIGYSLLVAAFLALLFTVPLLAPNGLSEAEMNSAVQSSHLAESFNIVDLPYHALQFLSLRLFGLTPYAIKLPSLLIGSCLAFLFILLLNRWFKNNVAIIASILTVLSGSFLYPATSGTPLIMVIFWPTLLLWLGSKIQGVKKPKPLYCFIFAIILLLAIFTPFMAYLAGFIVLYAILQPHLRFTIKSLPRIPFAIVSLFVVVGLGLISFSLFKSETAAADLLLMKDFTFANYFGNLKSAFAPFFAWHGSVDGTVLAPLIGLATFTLALTGLISTTSGFFASRNSIATCFILFTILIAGFRPDFAILLILPFSILIAHGIRYILEKWYGLFPENPYARIFGIFPISLLLGIIIISDLTHFVFGYRYNPAVADNFTTDLTLITKNLTDQPTTLLIPDEENYDFYKLLENDKLTITNDKYSVQLTPDLRFASLGTATNLDGMKLSRIITSSKLSFSDRIYIYSPVETEQKIEEKEK